MAMSSTSIGGTRWHPAFDAAAAGIGHAERARPAPTERREPQVLESDGQPEDQTGEGAGRERRRAPESQRYGGAPDPSGNAGKRLDAFA